MDAYSPKSKENLTVTSFFSDGDDLPFNIIYLVKEKDTNLLFDFLPKYDMVLFHFFIFYVFQKMCHRFVHIRPLLGIFCFFSMFCFRGQNSLNLHRLVPGNPGTVIRLRLKLKHSAEEETLWRCSLQQGQGLVSGSGSGGRQGRLLIGPSCDSVLLSKSGTSAFWQYTSCHVQYNLPLSAPDDQWQFLHQTVYGPENLLGLGLDKGMSEWCPLSWIHQKSTLWGSPFHQGPERAERYSHERYGGGHLTPGGQVCAGQGVGLPGTRVMWNLNQKELCGAISPMEKMLLPVSQGKEVEWHLS